MPSGDSWVIDPQIGIAAAADYQPWRLQRMPGAIDLQHKGRPVDGSVAGPATAWGNACHCLR